MGLELTFEAEPFEAYTEFDEAESFGDPMAFEWEGEATRTPSPPRPRTPPRAPSRPPAPAQRRKLTLPGKGTSPRPARGLVPKPPPKTLQKGAAPPGSRPSAASPLKSQAAPRLSPVDPSTVKVDPADPRIDVGAKFSLQRMLKRADAQQDAARLIKAVNDKRLKGIFGDDLKAAVDVASSHGTQRWLLVPKGEDAVLVVNKFQPLNAAPTVIFRGDTPNIRSNQTRIDAALQKASRTFALWDSKQLTECGGTTSAEIFESEGEDASAPVPGIFPPVLCLRSGGIIPVNVPPITAADVPTRFASALSARAVLNEDNVVRTAFYLAYWKDNKEVPWALLAHLVSRNAGYQMTDLRRYIKYLNNPVTTLLLTNRFGLLGLPGVFLNAAVLAELIRFVEGGNFLIFHDVFPQLKAYELAKQTFKQTNDAALALLFFDQLAAEGVDSLIVNEWRQFFGEARKANFFEGVAAPESDPAVTRMSHVLIVNEQNYIEDRLLVPLPGVPEYAALPQGVRNSFFAVADALNLTKLVFTASEPAAPSTPSTVFLHTISGNFSSLTARINTGRKLFFGAFLKSPSRAEAIKRFAESGPAHDGSRTNYDATNFTTSPNAVTERLRGRISSVTVPRGALPRWPGPPPTLRDWSSLAGRASLFTTSLPVLPSDAFDAPEGEALTAGAGRPTNEVLA